MVSNHNTVYYVGMRTHSSVLFNLSLTRCLKNVGGAQNQARISETLLLHYLSVTTGETSVQR